MTSAVVTVNAIPAPIVGASQICVGQMAPYADPTPGGTWSSSTVTVGTVGALTGVVGGISPGITNIYYTLSGTGCGIGKVLTVNPNPAPISGPNVVCLTSTITLTDVGGGTWSSSDTTIATVGATTGVVSGLALGSATITYTLGTTCYVVKPVTVINAPASPVGPTNICAGQTVTLTSPSGPGTWSSGTLSVATIGATTGTLTGWSPGTSVITFSLGAGCSSTVIVTVNGLPAAISGGSNVCVGSTVTLSSFPGGGTWSTSAPGTADVGSLSGIVTGIAPGTSVITYALATGCSTSALINVNPGPAPIAGSNVICVGLTTTLSDVTPGGTWSSTNPGVGSIDAFGTVTGVSAGVTTISYMVSGGLCAATTGLTVNAMPVPISGPSNVCQGQTITLTDSISGGVWSSSSPGIAAIGSLSGVVTAFTGFTIPVPVVITYTLGAGCDISTIIMVNPLPTPISGPSAVCEGQTITLFDATAGGTWSGSSSVIADVGSATGDVTGLSAGTVMVSYTNGYSCSATYPVTVNQSPTAIGGSLNVCLGGTSHLTNGVSGGSWVSIMPTIASVDATGLVTGVSLGSTTIVYSLAGGCFVTANVTVHPLPLQFLVTGGGSFCASDAGVHIGLASSTVGVNYYVYRGSSPVGLYSGTGGAMDFGLFTVGGTYTVVGVSSVTGCSVTMLGSAVVNVIPSPVPAVMLGVGPNDTVCAGTSVTFTPIPVNGGTAPTYVWYVNSYPVALTASYTFIPADGDIVSVTMTSNLNCAFPTTASGSVTMKVDPFMEPVVDIAPTPNDTVCKGTLVTVNALPLFGGTAPLYTWIRNTAPMSGTAGSFSFAPVDGDELYVIMNSSYPCRLSNSDTSAMIRFMVEEPDMPIVSITANPGTTVGHNQNVTLTAVAPNAVNPTYQWYVNGMPIASATNSSYTSSAYSYPDQDSVSVAVTTHGICTITGHQWVYIQVTTVGVQNVTQASDINVIPNPNKGTFVIKGSLGSLADEEVSMEITDMIGQVVYRNKVMAKNGKLNEQVTLAKTIANGMYILSLHSGADNKVFHIVVEE